MSFKTEVELLGFNNLTPIQEQKLQNLVEDCWLI
jgi:hypothetical protein